MEEYVLEWKSMGWNGGVWAVMEEKGLEWRSMGLTGSEWENV